MLQLKKVVNEADISPAAGFRKNDVAQEACPTKADHSPRRKQKRSPSQLSSILSGWPTHKKPSHNQPEQNGRQVLAPPDSSSRSLFICRKRAPPARRQLPGGAVVCRIFTQLLLIALPELHHFCELILLYHAFGLFDFIPAPAVLPLSRVPWSVLTVGLFSSQSVAKPLQ